MKYNKIQKFLSFFLIFILLFSITFRVPLPDFKANATSNDVFDLVSIIVDQETYGEIEDELRIYGRDISSVLENTKVVILPVPSSVTPFQIASMNEGLFFDGYKSLANSAFESKLVGTVLVGNIPLPEVYKNSEVSRTILPYTDFIEKSYIYNRESGKYEYNTSNNSGISPEIWHGVISPNTGSKNDDITAIKDYFTKNHSFYTGVGMYSLGTNTINGNPSQGNPDNYSPYVFYYDSIREAASVNYGNYLSYQEGYLGNKEDIVYNRYTMELAKKLKEQVLSYTTSEIYDLVKKIDPNTSLEEEDFEGMDSIPDIQSRHIINTAKKKFIEIFSGGGIGELRENVYNAGRYNSGQQVNVDFIPYLITILDVVNDEMIKDLNNDLENEIDNLVKNGLSRKIGLPTKYTHENELKKFSSTYTNYLYGKNANQIINPYECSIYRGAISNGGQLVEANRGTNILNIEGDLEIVNRMGNYCMERLQTGASLEGLWGKNSPFNLDSEQTSNGVFKLKTSDLKGAIRPIYDIAGATRNYSESNVMSPLDCIKNNYLLEQLVECMGGGGDNVCTPSTTYKLPSGMNFSGTGNWSCTTDSNASTRVFSENKTFDQNYQSLKAGRCEILEIKLDGVVVKSDKYKEICSTGGEGDSICECTDVNGWDKKTWDYKSIPSIIEHKSPTAEELKIQIDSMVASALPVDKDRYVDFIAANGKYTKINYPYLFRLELTNKANLSFENVSSALDSYLDEISNSINNIIEQNKPSLSSGLTQHGFVNDTKINHYLTTGTYPNTKFDLKSYLKSKGNGTIDIDGGTKNVDYYDILVFALYWNNLNSVSAKYKFVFENYLSTQGENENKFYLPRNKNQYEISYLGANGDSQNMFVGLDPENKGDNPFADIVGQNQDLSTKLLGLNVGSNSDNGDSDNKYKCGSPEGVPIWEWFPAIVCRLEDMMPPTISIGDGNCGPSLLDLLTAEEVEEYNQCNGDYNKNGVNDCLEKNLKDAVLALETDSSKHFYNSQIPLIATVRTKDGKDIPTVGATNIAFELVRLEKAKNEDQEISQNNLEVLYDVDGGKTDKSIWKNYLTFSNQSIRATAGKAQYGVAVKNSDINIYFQAKLNVSDSNKSNIADLKSEILKIEVRGERLFISAVKFDNDSDILDTLIGTSSVQANNSNNIYILDPFTTSSDSIRNFIDSSSLAQEKMLFNIYNIAKNGTLKSLDYPLTASLFKGEELIETITINNINNFVNLSPISKSGEYRLEITDRVGTKNSKTFTITPSSPSSVDLNLGSNILGIGEAVTTNYITILDKFNNVVSGEMYNIEMSIEGNGVNFFDNNQKNLNTSTFEGYKIFRLKSADIQGDNKINIAIKDNDGNRLLTTSKDLKVVEDFDITVTPSGNFNIGGNNYSLKVEVRNKNGNILTGLNSRIYAHIDSHYLDLDNSYFDIINGVGNITFKTKTIAGKDIPIEFQVEGLGKIVSDTITIFPDKPIKMDLVISKSRMEAVSSEYSNVQIELKDRYNNLVFNDSFTNLELTIPEQYSHILTSPTLTQTIKEGKAVFRVYGTVNPGVGYFKVSSSPSLSQNSFVVEDEGGNVTVIGVGENAGKIETYYMWNKEKISNMNYNSIYTTLLGASYGDFEQKDYLAGALIFDKNSKALAVTSILNNPYLFNNTLSISRTGGIYKLFSSTDLTQDISTNVAFDNGKLYLDLFNNSLNIHIGKIYYSLPSSTKAYVCEGDISGCVSKTDTSVFGKNTNTDYKFYTVSGGLQLIDNYGKTYLEVKNDGTITRYGNINFELLSSSNGYLELNVRLQDKVIGLLGFNFINNEVNITRDELLLKNKIATSNNNISILMDSLAYGYYTTGRGNSLSITIYYNDPFSSDKALNGFSRGQADSYEGFKDNGGTGWKDGNKTLLSFAAGKTVGEAVKENASFSVINIGDPVISLKTVQKKFADSNELKQFDPTIGELISDDDQLVGFRLLDYNNNGLSDVLLIKRDGKLKLLENRNNGDRFLDLGDLAYVSDISSLDTIQTGDFTGDGYSDIFFLGKNGKPYLLNNKEKKFSRISLENKLALTGNVIRAEVFDMDNDGIDDIVILEDTGEINIFYGEGISGGEISFYKLNVTNEYGITLDSGIKNDKGLFYFDGLYQIGQVDYSYILGENENYLKKLSSDITSNVSKAGNANSNPKTVEESMANAITDTKEDINYDLINNYIFEQISYSKEASANISINDINDLYNLPESQDQTTFIKSEYSQVVGLKLEKNISKRGDGFMSAGDIIDVEIKISNSSGKELKDVAFIESVYEFIELDESTIKNSLNLPIKRPSSGHDFLIDNFSLSPGDTVTLNYSGVMRKIKYLDIRVGLFEEGETGDDPYGDILVQASSKNCGDPADIFRSVSVRHYEKGIKEPTCDNSALPEQLELNSVDKNNNGIPDYFETLMEDNDARQEYATEQIKEMNYDSDGDGIPDWDDDFNMEQSFLVNIGEMGAEIEKGLDQIQEVIDGLSCGFNNGACFSTPLNWAPLAPGSDPTFMGIPIGDGLKINEGLPVFSTMTGMQMMCGLVPCCIPSFWPLSPLGFVSGPSCGPISAGGRLGVRNPANTFRLFITPTLTGAVGIAACFGGPAIVKGYTNPPGLHPLTPGGNCVVVARAILGCKNDGSDGDPSSIGIPDYGNGGTTGFGVINGNCTVEIPKTSLVANYVEDYYKHITGQSNGGGLSGDLSGVIVEDHSTLAGESLFQINGTGTPVDVTYDFESGSFNFGDIKKIVQKRIGSFPDFLMNWVTAQVEEIITKLTSFPTFFIILPDFSGIYDFDSTWEENRARWNTNKQQSSGLVTINQKDKEDSILGTVKEKVQTVNTSIKEAYEFISTLPFINLDLEPVNISVPWISMNELEKGLENRKMTVTQRKDELYEATESWSLGKSCQFTNPEEQAACEKENDWSEKLAVQAGSLIKSLESNIEAIEDYKNIPEKITKLLNKKEDYLEQIICNIDSISEIMGGRIGRNGEIFKSWIELYVLVKAILKSWQLLIDIYIEYEEGCRECKNERNDLMYYIFKLISMIIPDIPVIEFPKWPDIILDLHNIRAGLNVSLPEFNITPRPILLPPLPSLSLPTTPSGNLGLPELPVIPTLMIPDLPDIPSLPTVELPDLPPAPTLPNLLAALEIILDIGRLVTKAMCILKSSPFVPEWRAGDQIAFITERNGYLPTDFLDLNLPQFSLPAVDAIQVSSFVNLEFDTEFITELARQIAMPINSFNSDFSNLFNISIQDLDFSGVVPDEVNANINQDGSVDSNVQGGDPTFTYPIIDSNLQGNGTIIYFASAFVKNIKDKVTYINDNKDKTVNGKEFKLEVAKYLSEDRIKNDPGYDEIRELWAYVNAYTFANEDKLINTLEKESEEKFNLVKDILNTEIQKNKKIKNDFNDYYSSGIKKVSTIDDASSINFYNTQLDRYNEATFNNLKKVIDNNPDNTIEDEIKLSGEDLLNKSNSFFGKFTGFDSSDNLLAQNTLTVSNYTSQNSCSTTGNGDYGYNYEGIYITENGKSYRLFDYKKELFGDEVKTIVDIEGDGDDDIIYQMNGAIYLKENHSTQRNKIYLNEYPSVITASNNKFVNNSYIESVNNAKSYASVNSMLSLTFSPLQGISNYRLSYYDTIDKFYNQKNTDYTPKNIKKNIIDSISGIGTSNLVEESQYFNNLKDIVYISNVGDLRGVEVTTPGFNNIKNDLDNGNVVVLGNGTSIYSGESVTTLRYVETGNDEVKTIIVPKNRHIQLKSPLNVVGITGNGYVKSGENVTYSGTDIRYLIGKPLFPGTTIKFTGDEESIRDNSYIDLRYYDNSILNLNFNYDNSWELYDLGVTKTTSYSIALGRGNGYYYAKLNAFQNGLIGTSSNLILLSPQQESEKIGTAIDVSTIKIPVYQEKEFDLTDFIYEDLKISGIKELYVDFDLEVDSDDDGNMRNDRDSDILETVNINNQNDKTTIKFGPFEELYKKKIAFVITDINDNVSTNEVTFEVYSPIPEIQGMNSNNIYGSINEELSEEPISIFRVRGGVITKLEDTQGLSVTKTTEGKYDFSVPEQLRGIKIEKDGEVVASIDETTGKITTYEQGYSIKVLSSNDKDNDILYPKIILRNNSENVFYEGIKINGANTISIINNFDNIIASKEKGLYMIISNPNSYIFDITPQGALSNPGSIIISRSGTATKEDLFTIFPDGRINTLNEKYVLEYDSYDRYIVLKLMDKHFNREVARVLYKVESDFVIQ